MVSAKSAIYYAFHPNQLRSMIQWKVWHEPVHTRDQSKEAPTLTSCFHFLNLTSRSFAAVIQELNSDMLVPIALFYLVLRGLDTIEDDMTIDADTKEPLLRDFYKNMRTEGWTFNGNGPMEKDRELLIHFDVVVAELQKLKKGYYDIIEDITIKMGNGMADYALGAEHKDGIETIAQYEEYCHYVAGLVGEGLTRLFVEGNYANPALMDRMELTESMGQFLQKTNIVRDVHEDFLDKRRFWPKAIWSKYVDKWEDIFEPKNRTLALQCSSEMVLNALKHADECLFYMAGIREQSVFNFVAIPQSMAIATLELVFQNPKIFDSHIKITKGDACQLMIESTQNLRVVCDTFRRYARRIAKKNDPRDPHYLEISSACGKIEQFIETLFPSQDPKKVALVQDAKKDEDKMDPWEGFILIGAAILVLLLVSGLMIGVAWAFGARFDAMFDKTWTQPSVLPDPSTPTTMASVTHGEL
ncbi:isoprenoid synthase domain-containing protein [Pseudomassariella vexata]|uniref:Squalene synthase n=1 Tax=Pseudomassariella vexata TaxID=1141098 RepID=A0A1Y2DF67_9PEZI|nr:isoprenoid synthase domain-containing protein [Pseudomassariella vexata]ORY57920.1 isoprenoid synthase domain-containing protein [Pseudomassariella vexata]